MYLRDKENLSIGEIARSWSEERDGPSTPLNSLTLLLQGFWQARLINLHRPGNEDDIFSREQSLKALVAIAERDPHPGLLLTSDGQESSPSITRHQDGGITVDLRKRIVVPKENANWTDTQCVKAYEVLAECRAKDYSADFLTGFRTFHVAKRPFLVFIRLYGLRPPTFWFDPDQPGRGLLAPPKLPKPASAKRGRGRPAVYDHKRINNFLESLLLDEGLTAFTNKATVYKRLQNHLGAKSTPSEGHFGTYLNKWMAEHDPPLRTV